MEFLQSAIKEKLEEVFAQTSEENEAIEIASIEIAKLIEDAVKSGMKAILSSKK